MLQTKFLGNLFFFFFFFFLTICINLFILLPVTNSLLDPGFPEVVLGSSLEISQLVPEKIFEGFTIYGCGGHLGHVTQMPRTNFPSPYP